MSEEGKKGGKGSSIFIFSRGGVGSTEKEAVEEGPKSVHGKKKKKNAILGGLGEEGRRPERRGEKKKKKRRGFEGTSRGGRKKKEKGVQL